MFELLSHHDAVVSTALDVGGDDEQTVRPRRHATFVRHTKEGTAADNDENLVK